MPFENHDGLGFEPTAKANTLGRNTRIYAISSSSRRVNSHCTVCSRAPYNIELGLLVWCFLGRVDLVNDEHAKSTKVDRDCPLC